MDFQKIYNFVYALGRNTMGITLVTETTPRMNKRGNIYFGRVTKRTIMTNMALGRDYKGKVNKVLESNGLDKSFGNQKPSGRHPYDSKMFFWQSDTDSEKFYLRVMFNKNTESQSTYYVDGRVATDSEVEEIKKWLYKPSPSAKQMACGLAPSKTEPFVAYLTSSIVSIAQGDKVLE